MRLGDAQTARAMRVARALRNGGDHGCGAPNDFVAIKNLYQNTGVV